MGFKEKLKKQVLFTILAVFGGLLGSIFCLFVKFINSLIVDLI